MQHNGQVTKQQTDALPRLPYANRGGDSWYLREAMMMEDSASKTTHIKSSSSGSTGSSSSKHRHHRHRQRQPPPPPPLDDIEELVPLDEWGQDPLRHAHPAVGLVVLPRKISTKSGSSGSSSNANDAASLQHVSALPLLSPVSEVGTKSEKIVGKAKTLTTTTMTSSCGVAPPSSTLPSSSASSSASSASSPPVPGTERLWVKTFGCSHNVSDSEYMEGMLSSYGYTLLPEAERDDASLWLLNSCTVKNPSQQGMANLITKAHSQGKSVVVAGCVPQGDRFLTDLEGCSLLGLAQLERVVEVVEQTLAGHTVKLLSKAPLPRLDIPKVRKNPLVEIIPLSTGCLGACTYCKTRHARGKLGSYALEAIWDRARQVLEEGGKEGGVTEIWLSSEDTGAYGRDLMVNIGEGGREGGREATLLPRLLEGLTDLLPTNVMLRVGMTNPPYILNQLDAMAACLRHPNVFSFLHVPVQAGSNRVLAAMKREYTVEEFCRVVDTLRAAVPGVTIATDIICGFPGETEEDFLETLALVEKYKFSICNISQFYPRPGTPAAKMPKVPSQVVKDRSRRLTRLFESFDPYAGMEGGKQGGLTTVWINRERSEDGRYAVGHTKAYVKVLVPWEEGREGVVAQVKITRVARWHVWGEVVSCERIRKEGGREGRGPGVLRGTNPQLYHAAKKEGKELKENTARVTRAGAVAGIGTEAVEAALAADGGVKEGKIEERQEEKSSLFSIMALGKTVKDLLTPLALTTSSSSSSTITSSGSKGESAVPTNNSNSNNANTVLTQNSKDAAAAAVAFRQLGMGLREREGGAAKAADPAPQATAAAAAAAAAALAGCSTKNSCCSSKSSNNNTKASRISSSSSRSSSNMLCCAERGACACSVAATKPDVKKSEGSDTADCAYSAPFLSFPFSSSSLPSSESSAASSSSLVRRLEAPLSSSMPSDGKRHSRRGKFHSPHPEPSPTFSSLAQTPPPQQQHNTGSSEGSSGGNLISSLSPVSTTTMSGGSTTFFSRLFFGRSSSKLSSTSSWLWRGAKAELLSVSFWALMALLSLIVSWLARCVGIVE